MSIYQNDATESTSSGDEPNQGVRARGKSTKPKPSFFDSFAPVVAKNGFTVIPINKKEAFTRKWTNPKPTDLKWLGNMVRAGRYSNCNVGIVGGRVVGIDGDAKDQAEADWLKGLAFKHLGHTEFIRTGRAPRFLLLYRSIDHIGGEMKAGCVQILGYGRQFVAYGIHPDTERPYQWLDAKRNPANTKIEDLPAVSAKGICAFLEGVALGRHPHDSPAPASESPSRTQRPSQAPSTGGSLDARIVRDERGLVVDGREALLTKLTAAEYARGGFGSPDDLAHRVWAKFGIEVDALRPKGRNTRIRWSYRDARAKAREICRRKPNLRPPVRRARGGHPASHLHHWRRPDYWTPERRQQHLAEVVHRIVTPSTRAVAREMIAAVDLRDGICKTPIARLVERTGLSKKTVTQAREDLVKAGLWIAAGGVYVPVPSLFLNQAQHTEKTEENALPVTLTVQGLNHSQPAEKAGINPVPVTSKGDPCTVLSSPPLESESASAASQPANGSKLKGWHDGRYYVDGFDCTPSPAFVALLRGEYVPDDPYCSNGADIAEQAIDPGESDSLLTLSCETAKSLENNDTAIATGSDPVNPALNPPSFMAGDPSNSGAPAISRSREPLPDWLVGPRRNPTIAPPAPAAIPAVAPRRAPAAHADGSNVIHLADVRPKHGESL